jgi:ankyrin repeat protein
MFSDDEFSFPNRLLLGQLCHDHASDLEAVKKLIAAGGDINAQSSKGGATIFYKAMEINSEMISDEVLRYLIDHYQPNLNEHHGFGDTPLFYMVSENRLDMVKYMLALGADPLIEDETGSSILEEAISDYYYNKTHEIKKDFTEMVEILQDFLDKK